jgi:hypothetical protein
MSIPPETDKLTKFEKRVYFHISWIFIGANFLLMFALKYHGMEATLPLNAIMFILLLIGVVFGWGYNKDVRVLDLRKFSRDG